MILAAVVAFAIHRRNEPFVPIQVVSIATALNVAVPVATVVAQERSPIGNLAVLTSVNRKAECENSAFPYISLVISLPLAYVVFTSDFFEGGGFFLGLFGSAGFG